jgi:hypothetical protein
MSAGETASIFAALYEWDRKNGGGGGGGKPKMQVQAGGRGLKLHGVKGGARRFHAGHRLSGQRINNIVKVKFVRNNYDATRHIIQHIDYIEKRERDQNEPERQFYTKDGTRTRDEVIDTIMRNRGEDAAMFKIILSPKQNELNHVEYTREIMRRFEEKTGIVTDWSLVEHKNTEHHHVHIVMPGRDVNGYSFRLEKEHLEILRELANEYQYELQDLVYEREKQIEQEFGLTRDESNMLIESRRDFRDMKDLGVYRPEVDKQVREELLTPTNFDDIYFCQQLQREIMNGAAQDFKQLEAELQEAMMVQHPELYAGFKRELQGTLINDSYFQKLKEVDPLEYQRYLSNPNLDRTELISHLKQTFPEWYDPIVHDLKERKPELFADYQKPAQTDREIMDNLTKTNPELFPDLSRQIQENQKNLAAMAYLAHSNPELFSKINDEPDRSKQHEMLAEAQKDFPDMLQQMQEKLAEKFPDIYKAGERTPSHTEIMIDLVKSDPELFPQATAQLQRLEVDTVLYERFRQEYPEAAEKFEHDPNAHGIITNLMRANRPDLLEEATKQVREEQPELFKHEHSQPTQTEMLKALLQEKAELFPQAMNALKNQEIDKAYFDKAKETMPDGLQAYVENPELDRTELHKVLRNTFPEWRPGIEAELKEKTPQLFAYESPRSNQEILDELRKTNPELFPGLKTELPEKEIDPKQAKLDEIKERLIDEGYFARGRENMSDGLIAYLEDSDLDRKYIIDGLRQTYPEWAKEIENQLKELHPYLFKPPDKERQQVDRAAARDKQKDAAEKLRHAAQEGRADSPERTQLEALLLLALAVDVEKEPDDQEREDLGQEQDKDGEKDKDDPDKEQNPELSEAAEKALYDAERFQTGHGWAGLTGLHHGAFIGEPVDLQGEARILFEDQKEVAQEMDDLNALAEQIDPMVFQIEDVVAAVEDNLKEHEKEQEIEGR